MAVGPHLCDTNIGFDHCRKLLTKDRLDERPCIETMRRHVNLRIFFEQTTYVCPNLLIYIFILI